MKLDGERCVAAARVLGTPTSVQCGEGLQHAEYPVPYPRRGGSVRFLDFRCFGFFSLFFPEAFSELPELRTHAATPSHAELHILTQLMSSMMMG